MRCKAAAHRTGASASWRISEPWEARRWLCNTLLAKRTQAWEARQEAVDEYEQTATRPGRKAALRPDFKQAQGVQERVQDGRLAKSLHHAAWRPCVPGCARMWQGVAGCGRDQQALHRREPAHTSQDYAGGGNRRAERALAGWV